MYYGDDLMFSDGSLSARRAWIENVKFLVSLILPLSLSARRAWIEKLFGRCYTWIDGSLSARRAWIENVITAMTGQISVVALRKESVDRKYIIKITGTAPRRSLSARRAWIEKTFFYIILQRIHCRSPQGERG